MIRILIGIIIGMMLVLIFIYVGGGDVIERAGKEVQKIGTKSNQLERELKTAKDDALKAIENWRDRKNRREAQ
jgi:H+/gluconate symporter-like permease